MNIEDILSKIELLPFSNERVLLTENLFYIDLWNCMDIMIVKFLKKTVETFDRLQKKFGKENVRFKSWYGIVTKVSVDRLVSLYNKEYSTSYTYDEIYANVLKKYHQNIRVCKKICVK